MGKTEMLKNMAVQDIQGGNGMGFVDPHGEAAEELLHFVKDERVEDVIYFNPADTTNPIAFNVMEDVEPELRHLVASGLMSVFKKVWPDVWSARMEYILNNTVLALLEYPGSTLLGINRMLVDVDYRKKVVDSVTDSTVKAFWVSQKKYLSEEYDCDDFAFWFKAWAAGLGMTSVGLVIDDTGEHAYNIVVLSFGQGAPLSVKLVEPQTGGYATRNRDAGKYRLHRGIIII